MSKSKIHVSLKGTAVFPSLNAPDPKYGRLKVKLLMSKEDSDKMKAEYDAAFKELYAAELAKQKKQKIPLSDNCPFQPQTREDGTETGMMLVGFSRKGSYTDKTGKVIATRLSIVDSQKNPINDEIWSGSELKIAFTYRGYVTSGKFGVSLTPVAVQVLKLVTRGDNSGVADAVFNSEDGYVSSESEEEGEETPAVNGDANVVPQAGKAEF